MKKKRILLAVACLAVIAAAGYWIWRTQFNQPTFNVALHQGLGQVMAEQTMRALNNTTTGKIVLITLPAGAFPELVVQMDEFKKTIARHPGFRTRIYELETDDRPKFRFGAGLSARRYVRIVNKNLDAAALVSLVGAPELKESDMAELKAAPKLIAECRSADKLKKAFDLKAIHTAVVGRFEYPTPIKGTPRTPHEWVEQRFQIVTAETAAALPAAGNDVDAARPEK